MSETTAPYIATEPDEVTAGWLFATANALGLSDADLAYVLDIREDTIRKHWKYGTQPIPDGVREDLKRFITFTDECVDVLVSRAEDHTEPALIVYSNLRDVPPGHVAATYGITWWDHVAFSVQKERVETYVGYTHEVAAAYDYSSADVAQVHDDPAVIAIYASSSTRPRVRR